MERPDTPDQTDPIERELLGAAGEPSPRFAVRVMAAVRREAATPPPLAFPWRRLVLGLLACALWLVLGYGAIAGGDAAEVRALAQRWELLVGLALLLALLSLRLARYCVRS